MDDEEFTEHLIDLLGYEQAYHFYLVSRGLKPGAMFLDLNQDYKDSIEEACPEKYETYVQESELFNPSVFRRLSARFGWASSGLYNVYISPSEERINDLRKNLESDQGNSRVMGEFLGYPESAIKYFNGDFDESPLYRTRRKINEMRKNEALTREERKLIDYVEFVPADTEKSIHRAVDRGRRFRRGLENDGSQISNLFLERIKNEHRP